MQSKRIYLVLATLILSISILGCKEQQKNPNMNPRVQEALEAQRIEKTKENKEIRKKIAESEDEQEKYDYYLDLSTNQLILEEYGAAIKTIKEAMVLFGEEDPILLSNIAYIYKLNEDHENSLASYLKLAGLGNTEYYKEAAIEAYALKNNNDAVNYYSKYKTTYGEDEFLERVLYEKLK